jgi:hypothetical protein
MITTVHLQHHHTCIFHHNAQYILELQPRLRAVRVQAAAVCALNLQLHLQLHGASRHLCTATERRHMYTDAISVYCLIVSLTVAL